MNDLGMLPERLVRSARDVGLLVVRCVLGVILLTHGWRRWRVLGLDHEIARLRELELPSPTMIVWVGTAFEIIGGILLIFGLGTIVVGLLAIVQQLLIITHVKQAFLLHNGGYEFNLALMALGVVCLLYGSGRLGVDHLFARRAEDEPEPVIEDTAPV